MNSPATIIRQKNKILTEPGYCVWHWLDGSRDAVHAWFRGAARVSVRKEEYIWEHWPTLSFAIDDIRAFEQRGWELGDEWTVDAGSVSIPQPLTLRFMGVFHQSTKRRIFVVLPSGVCV